MDQERVRTALLIIDVQNDFCEPHDVHNKDPSLSVPASTRAIEKINALRKMAKESSWFDMIVCTRDWHPVNHVSFRELWPPHCIRGTHGAELHKLLDVEDTDMIWNKGTETEVDSYSAFWDNAGEHSTGLEKFLKEREITELVLVGIAGDICVHHSAMDAIQAGFDVAVIEECCAYLNEAGKQDSIQKIRSEGGVVYETIEQRADILTKRKGRGVSREE